MAKFCPFCGEKLVDEAKFCKNCGKDVSSYTNIEDNQTYAGDYGAPVVEKSHTIAAVLGFITAIFIPIIGLIFGIYLITRKDSSKAKTYGIIIIVLSLVVWFVSFIATLYMY